MTRPRSPVTGVGALATRERQDRALHLRRQGLQYPAIAREVGYASAQSAANAVQSALNRQPAEDAAAIRAIELARYDNDLEKLDRLELAAWRQLDMDHVMVNHGQVIPGVVDESGKLAALDRLLKIVDSRTRISERRCRLLGLDAPTRTRVEVITQDVVDLEISRLEAELAARGSEPGQPAPTGGAAPAQG